MKPLFKSKIVSAWDIAVRETVTALIARVIAFFLTRLIKRDKNLVVVFSRSGFFFADNSKYFFIYATEWSEKNEHIVLLTDEPNLKEQINVAGGESILHPSFQSFHLLLRCGKIVTDVPFTSLSFFPITTGAKLIQLWHGAPLKHIELDVYRTRLYGQSAWKQFILKSQKLITGRYPVHDLVLTTSGWFIDHAFKKCFHARQFVSAGYPRNDILFGWPETNTKAFNLAWINVDRNAMEFVAAAKSRKQKICLYVPTFRKNLADPFQKHIDLERLSNFAEKNNLLIVLKLHPLMHEYADVNTYPNILEYASLCDVYPLMPLSDFLITDYSSIYFDYLLLDRPIIFYAYDLADYLAHDRSMYFEYESMTPGKHCHTYEALETQIQTILANSCRDGYSDQRAKIRKCAHDHVDNQSSRRLICHYLKTH